METYQFEATLQPDQHVRVPPEIAQALPAGQTVRFIIVVEDDTEDADWKRYGLEQLFKGHGEEDDAFDQVSAG